MSPPGVVVRTKATGAVVSVAVYDSAAAAIRRAGFEATRSRVRMVVRAQAEVGMLTTEFDWWDALVRSVPLGVTRARPVARRPLSVSPC